jgi:hypothetical protein
MRYFITLFLIAALAMVTFGKSEAYIMPAGQLIDLMTANFSNFKTLVITQSTHLIDPQDQETEMWLGEKIQLKSPGFFLSRPAEPPEEPVMMGNEAGTGRLSSDMTFRRLFLANDGEMIMALLSELGINIDSVGLTRFDGVIAYRLGDKDTDMPKLFIEKERFIPLLLSYRLWGGMGYETVNVRFNDYRKLELGWYPHDIAYSAGKEVMERYYTVDLQVNAPVDEYPLSEIRVQTMRPIVRISEKRTDTPVAGLTEIINILKKKYH